MNANPSKIGVLLMTYGSATTADHVPEYFDRIYRGKASPALVADFKNRYRLVGRSPLIDITEQQAALLESELGSDYIVRAGMRHSAPFINEAAAACKQAGAGALIGVILSPQFSSSIMEGYRRDFTAAAARHGFDHSLTEVVRPWGTEPKFISLLADLVRQKLSEVRAGNDRAVPVIFTTHSLPQRVVAEDPSYLDQLQETIDAVRAELEPNLVWYMAYQSAGHTTGAWLKPDLMDVLAVLHRQHAPAVVLAPVQFLADHLEILYDLDIAAKQQCREFGMSYHRIELPNTNPLFISALADVVKRQPLVV